MTRKDYVRLADAMRSAYGRMTGTAKSQDAVHRIYVEQVAEALYRDNDRFDYKRFYEACGVAYD